MTQGLDFYGDERPREGDILVPAVKHSASTYLCNVIQEGKPSVLRPNRQLVHKETTVIHCHPYDDTMHLIHQMAAELPTVIPLRHPAFIAVSWKKRERDRAARQRPPLPKSMMLRNFLLQWERIHEIEGFHFCVEQHPFGELEDYLGVTVNHTTNVIHSIGEYDEKRDFVTAKDFLGKDWALVEKALDMPLGRKFYAADLCGL